MSGGGRGCQGRLQGWWEGYCDASLLLILECDDSLRLSRSHSLNNHCFMCSDVWLVYPLVGSILMSTLRLVFSDPILAPQTLLGAQCSSEVSQGMRCTLLVSQLFASHPCQPLNCSIRFLGGFLCPVSSRLHSWGRYAPAGSKLEAITRTLHNLILPHITNIEEERLVVLHASSSRLKTRGQTGELQDSWKPSSHPPASDLYKECRRNIQASPIDSMHAVESIVQLWV